MRLSLSQILKASGDHSLAQRADALERSLRLAISTIESHAEDWNDEWPRNRTDVTLILPELREAERQNSRQMKMRGRVNSFHCDRCLAPDGHFGSCLASDVLALERQRDANPPLRGVR